MRGELMKKLLASYGRDDEFRAVAEQIIQEEEGKNNRVLARTLRKTLEHGPAGSERPRALAPLIAFPHAASDFIERIEPEHDRSDIILSPRNAGLFANLLEEHRHAEEVRRHGLTVRSKLLFCGPPGCGKTLCAEVFAAELGLPLFVVKLDALISSYLGETAGNVRKIFEFAQKQPCVLFFDEFDALARSRDEAGDHNELRRVVNSLLLFIDRMEPRGFLVAATNLDQSLDPAIWRRFDEVVWFDRPDARMAERYLNRIFKNVRIDFKPAELASKVDGFSYAEIERACNQALKSAIIARRKTTTRSDLLTAIADEQRRRVGQLRLAAKD